MPTSISRQEVAASLGVTAGYLTSVFRKELGLTPWEYLTRLRIAHAKELLIQQLPKHRGGCGQGRLR